MLMLVRTNGRNALAREMPAIQLGRLPEPSWTPNKHLRKRIRGKQAESQPSALPQMPQRRGAHAVASAQQLNATDWSPAEQEALQALIKWDRICMQKILIHSRTALDKGKHYVVYKVGEDKAITCSRCDYRVGLDQFTTYLEAKPQTPMTCLCFGSEDRATALKARAQQ